VGERENSIIGIKKYNKQNIRTGSHEKQRVERKYYIYETISRKSLKQVEK
jgi:hypothetical protein